MTQAIILICVVLVLVVLILLARVQNLTKIAKGDEEKGGLTNKLNAALFVLIFLVGTSVFIWYTIKGDYLLPESASEHGKRTDSLMFVTTVIISIVFVLTNALLFFFAFRYQYKKGKVATYYPDNHKLEIIWTIIPALVLTYLVFNGWREWTAITDGPSAEEMAKEKPVELEIVGQQFYWNCRYPGQDGELGDHYYKRINASNAFGLKVEDKAGLDDFMPREIHIPVNKTIHFKIRAKDVLHSVFAPHFRLKMDAVPGMPTEFWFKPTKTTQQMREELKGDPRYRVKDEDGVARWERFEYEIACTEICGRGHFSMKYKIVVDTEEDYKKWYNEQKAWSENEDSKAYILDYLSENNPELLEDYASYIEQLSSSQNVVEEEPTQEISKEEEVSAITSL